MDRSSGCASLAVGIEQEIASLYELEAPGMLRYAVKIAGSRATAQDAAQGAFFRLFIALLALSTASRAASGTIAQVFGSGWQFNLSALPGR